jgi:hypothetical protein
MSKRKTPSCFAITGSASRGTAMSMIVIGR